MSFTIHLHSFAGGIFLLLGYSSTDEALLRPYTNLGVQDTIRGLQHYLLKHIANQVSELKPLHNLDHHFNKSAINLCEMHIQLRKTNNCINAADTYIYIYMCLIPFIPINLNLYPHNVVVVWRAINLR